ncbi:MAG: TPR end-of-group domain-containing protein [Planctomycetia bacterium]
MNFTMTFALRVAGAVAAITVLCPAAAGANEPATALGAGAAPQVAAVEPSVFEEPEKTIRFDVLMGEVVRALNAGRQAEAEKLVRDAFDNGGFDRSVMLYNLACIQSRRAATDAALDSLAAAVDAGWSDAEQMTRDPDLESLRESPRFQELCRDARARPRKAPARKSLPVADGVAEVADGNTVWIPQLGRLAVSHDFPKRDPGAEITTQKGPVGDLLRQWRQEGTAAGLHGFLYDNCDAAHSTMDYLSFPELSRTRYSAAAREAKTNLHGQGELHRGLQLLFLHDCPVIGNASVAQVGGAFWRSMPRVGMESRARMGLLADQYMNNMLYFYPEHNDHDPEPAGFGDVYPANTPYVITSQGSSGSDQPFMNGIASAIAAFRPETQRFVVERHLLVPTVQMIFRRSRTPVVGRDEYLSGTAHPPVFDAKTLDVERMVRMAHDLEADEVPPVVVLTVEEEDLGRPGIDYFEVGPAEKIFDTVSAVGRVGRSARFRRRMVVSAANTRDPNGQPLSFVWKLLHGDERRVRIKPLDLLGTRAEILVDWHPRGVYPGSDLPSRRVDVGVFADNGNQLSAPGCITWYFPANENRTYEDVPATADPARRDPLNGDSPQRIVSIERLPAERPGSYVDPRILTPADWTDTYRYDDRGNLLGWTRTGGGTTAEFTADGRRVTKSDADGRPVETSPVGYGRERRDANTMPRLRYAAQPVQPAVKP